jgi:hypothetical protein
MDNMDETVTATYFAPVLDESLRSNGHLMRKKRWLTKFRKHINSTWRINLANGWRNPRSSSRWEAHPTCRICSPSFNRGIVAELEGKREGETECVLVVVLHEPGPAHRNLSVV